MPAKRKAPHGCYWRDTTLWGKKIVRGTTYRWSLRTDDPKVAKQRYEPEARRLVGAGYFGEHRRAFSEVMAEWASWIASSIRPTSAERYAVSLAVLEPFLFGKFLDQIDGRLVAEIVRKRQADGVANSTIKRDLAALSSVVEYAKMHDWTKSNPVEDAKGLVKVRTEAIALPKPGDVELAASLARGMVSDLIRAAVATGCRQDELVSAKRSQLDLAAKTLTVIGKGRKLRVVDLEPFGGVGVFSTLPDGGPEDLLFWHGQRRRYVDVSSQFSAMVRRIANEHPGFRRFRFHDLRHLHAVEWLRSGRSIYDLQKRLGHTTIKITEGYCKFLTPEEERVTKSYTENKFTD